MNKSTAETPVQWLFLDLNAFFASCEQQETPALRGRPVIVVHAEECRHARVEPKGERLLHASNRKEPQPRGVEQQHSSPRCSRWSTALLLAEQDLGGGGGRETPAEHGSVHDRRDTVRGDAALARRRRDLHVP
jgi:hypothetical protein